MFEKATTYEAACTHKEPSHDSEVLIALKWLAERRANTASKILVLAPGKQNLAYSEVIRKNQKLLHCVSARTFMKDYSWRGGPALALWPTEQNVARLDGDNRITALAVVPWALADITPWIRARRPLDLSRTRRSGAGADDQQPQRA